MSPEELLAIAERRAQESLRRELRPLQRETLSHLAAGRSVFAGLPTGYGKSLCYWMPAAAWGWRVWVLSPLVSLIEDQAMACAELGLSAVALHAGLGRAEKKAREQKIWDGNPIVFLSPERLTLWEKNGKLRKWRRAGKGPELLALDEMHCFEEWREFRRSYAQVFGAIRRLTGGGTRLLGLSASLSAGASAAWMDEFCDGHEMVSTGLGRENLSLRVFAIEEERERWLVLPCLLRDGGEEESILIYCSTREECDSLSRWLCSLGHPACAYHAGIPPGVRAERSLAFRRGLLPIVCATSAFGMGIDFPRVARVIHFSLPYDLESYWQEAGRAGRDGRQAQACAIWRRSDASRARVMSERQRQRFLALWLSWLRPGCRKRAVAASLGLEAADCGRCDSCDPLALTQPAWLRELTSLRKRPAWWTETFAEGERWARQKILF